MINTNPCMNVNMSSAVSEALRKRGATEDAVDAGFGAGLATHSIYGQPVIAAGKNKKKKAKKEEVKIEEVVQAEVGGKRKRKAKNPNRQAGAKKAAGKNPWLIHMAKVRKENPNMKPIDLAKKAKESYKK